MRPFKVWIEKPNGLKTMLIQTEDLEFAKQIETQAASSPYNAKAWTELDEDAPAWAREDLIMWPLVLGSSHKIPTHLDRKITLTDEELS